ncbi:hypothetical protein MHU86_25962 [Fragilaria crotonensis]|nr:hypothetical protein MHU86_25962 [Fragilaria crotonensis]
MREKREEKVQETAEEIAMKNELFVKLAESSLRISLASFGGALVGLSLARRHAPPVLQKSQSLSGRAALSHDLPKQWAISCAVFASIFESSLWLSPTSMITTNPYLQTIGNFTMGGTVAGAVWRGLPVQRNRGRGATAIVAPRITAGVVSGLVLGFVPGVLVAGISMLQDYLEVLDAVDEEDSGKGEAKDPIGIEHSTSKENM